MIVERQTPDERARMAAKHRRTDDERARVAAKYRRTDDELARVAAKYGHRGDELVRVVAKQRRMDDEDELAPAAAKRGLLYRGVELQPLLTQPKTSRRRQLQEAVEYAIIKNAAALAGSK